MNSSILFIAIPFIFLLAPPLAVGKELPKIAVWDLEPRNTPHITRILTR